MKIALLIFVALLVLWWIYLVVRLLLYFLQSLFRLLFRHKSPSEKWHASIKVNISPSSARQAIENAVGPAPWYWQTFPTIIGSSGQRYVWTQHETTTSLVSLALEGELDRPRLVVDLYCRAFAVPPNHLGLWFPDQDTISIVCFNPDSLPPFDLKQVMPEFKKSERRFFAHRPPLSNMTIRRDLLPGTHAIAIPPDFASMEKLLMVESCPSPNRDDPFMAIFELHPAAQGIVVRPQNWFTSDRFDTSHEWITRVTYDPQSKRLVGDGIRLPAFRLTEDGCDLDCWLH